MTVVAVAALGTAGCAAGLEANRHATPMLVVPLPGGWSVASADTGDLELVGPADTRLSVYWGAAVVTWGCLDVCPPNPLVGGDVTVLGQAAMLTPSPQPGPPSLELTFPVRLSVTGHRVHVGARCVANRAAASAEAECAIVLAGLRLESPLKARVLHLGSAYSLF